MDTRWILRTARREAKRSPGVLFGLILTVAIGVAGVFGVAGFRAASDAAIYGQARELLGADLSVSMRREFPESIIRALDMLPAERVRETSFSSMILFPAAGKTRLAQIFGVAQGFPLYGAVDSNPPDAKDRMLKGEGALVDTALLLFFNARVGDRLKIGEREIEVIGELLGVPGSMEFRALVAPRVYVSENVLAETKLMQRGSSLKILEYLRLPPELSADQVKAELQQTLAEERPQIETATERQNRLTNANRNVSRFLYVLSCVSLVLCGLGVGSSVATYLRAKAGSIAVLRCLGATGAEALAVFGVQILAATIGGLFTGSVCGLLLRRQLTLMMNDLIPSASQAQGLVLLPILQASAVCLFLLFWFALPPLSSAYRISALQGLRAEVEPAPEKMLNRVFFGIAGIIAILLSAIVLAESAELGATLGAAVIGSMLLLLALTKLVLYVLKKLAASGLILRRLPFVLRQGVTNLARPFNQTALLLLAISTATFLLLVVYFVRGAVTGIISVSTSALEPNLIVFEADQSQLDPLAALAESHGIRVFDRMPLVAMRLTHVRGQTVQEIIAATDPNQQRWELTRLYRSSYRPALGATETVLSGQYVGTAPNDGGPVPVSLEAGIAKELGVGLGDRLMFDVQGVPIETRISSIRGVDWQRFRANFFVLFPTGVLESAPKTFVLAARADSAEHSANFQRAVVEQFPNVSIIDVRLVQQTVDRVLGRIQAAVQLMGTFAMLTAAIVLCAAILAARGFRSRENAIFKVLGASQGTIIWITFVEYVLLSAIAVAAAIGLAWGASTIVTKYYFDTAQLALTSAPFVLGFLVLAGCTVLGLWSSIGTYRIPPASVLRN